MWRLAQVQPLYIAAGCAAWVAFVVCLPRLMLLTIVSYYRVRARLSPATHHPVAFGSASWTSRHAMAGAALLPVAVIVGAWIVTRVLHPVAVP